MVGRLIKLPCALEVEKTALQAQKYVDTRLLQARMEYRKPLNVRPGLEQILVELDGCHIRTGKQVSLCGTELVCPLKNKDKIIYVARISRCSNIV